MSPEPLRQARVGFRSSPRPATASSPPGRTLLSPRTFGRPLLSNLRILVVEDEVKVANALKEGLEGERYEAVVAHTGEDAFFRINTEQFDVIVLDVMLPGRDGLQVLTTIRKNGI